MAQAINQAIKQRSIALAAAINGGIGEK